ncbi:MAG: TonB-dependent receptor [Alphaproteobacteria bacterium]|nr:TonB-dependent receptor [Alphaproteobacteria bacterium]MBU1515912.1 TonB-dependent receptor [Alphaproteobacteria bacterium]MBU2094134.1 TonB-dependent receptor [Alphaproteobacteria bacterium]MBU2151486.1 TonB-dependent receptor [Alphaproteobacteria bacterium]MBU2305238.1 TonB-dependent receptor [Alphaproteobacteria bacterium]
MTTPALRPTASAAFLGLLLCGVAPAAVAQTIATAAPAVDTAATADAAENDAGATVGEVTVTARRRQETVQSVPLAVSVIGGDKVDATGAFNVGRLQQLTPSLQYYSSNPRNTAVNIRGLGVPFGLTSDGFEQGVGFYVDDVYNARVATATFDFLDVSRIEVLRGPQGTLYGKNTTAGAVNITTNQPTFDFEAKAEVSVGNLAFKQAKAAVSGPLTDTIAARLAISTTSRRGTIYNVTSRQHVNAQDNLGIRGQILYKPSDDLAVTFAADYSKQDAACCAQIFVRTGATQRPLNRQYAALAAAQGYTVVSTNPFDRLTDVDANLNAGNKIGGASARVVWNVGPGTLTSITAWRFWDWKPENDRDFLSLSIVSKSQNPSQQDQYSQELRYNYGTERLDVVVGAFAFKQRIDTQGTEQQGPASSRWNITPSNVLSNDPTVLDGLIARNTQYLKNTSFALFGQASWKVTDAFTIQPGVRLNYDKKEGYYQRLVFDGQGLPVLFGQTGARRVAQLAVFTPQLSEPSFDDWNFSYDLTASYQIARDVLGYATYAKSFKSGGINQNGLPTDAAGNPILAAGTIKPEDVNHFEAGLKTQFWDRRATLNLSAFRTDIKDYQATVANGQLGVLRGYLANAGKVRSQGFEVDFQIRPSERFTAYANGAYTDATYRKFVDAPCPPELSGGATVAAGQTPSAPGTPGGLSPANCDISGQRLPGVSKWSFSFGAEANLPATFLGNEGEVYLGYDGSYRSNFSSNASPSAYTWVDGYGLSNFRAGFRTADGLNVFGWVRNAFDEDYFEQLAVGPSNTGLIAGNPGDPRTWGVTIKAAF